MAPEVIEMCPPTVASDVWSVGATIIELLTGSPPYFHLECMAAMFRIVQDEQARRDLDTRRGGRACW